MTVNPYNVNPMGVCPVQAEGTLPTGEWYYFRARGSRWGIDICTSEQAWNENKYIWQHHEPNAFAWPDGGWLTKDEAVLLATLAIDAYYAQKGRANAT